MVPVEELTRLARMGMKAALEAGAEQAEAYGETCRNLKVEMMGQEIGNVRTVHDAGLAVRAYYRGGMGFAYTMQLAEDAVAACGARAAELAKGAQPDPHFRSLPEPTEAEHIAGLFDEELAAIGVEGAAQLAERTIAGAREVDPRVILHGGVTLEAPRQFVIVNSLGLETHELGTRVQAWVISILKPSPEDVGSGTEYDLARNLVEFDPAWVGREATRKAQRLLRAEAAETRTCALLLTPNAVGRLVQGIAFLLRGEDIAYERSCLVGKLNTHIASPLLTLVDDGTVAGGFGSSQVDAEGVPKRRNILIEEGVLKSYLHNSYTAARLGLPNNASAVRGSYKTPLSTGLSNPQVGLGDLSLEEMVADIADGIYVDSFNPFPDLATGNISSMIDFGIQIKNGEFARPVKGTMLGGNILELLRNIDAVSREARREPGIILPYLRIREAQIAGR
jgi:PmbA protein